MSQETESVRLSWLSRDWKDWVGLAARLILGWALFFAGILKVGNLEHNVAQVRLYGLPLASWMETVIGYLQPPIEIFVGLLLIIGLFTRVNAFLGALAMAAFIFGISWAWAHGIMIDCGCFTPGGVLGPNEHHQYLRDILRDIFFMLCGIWLIWRPKSVLSLDGVFFKPLEFDDPENDEFAVDDSANNDSANDGLANDGLANDDSADEELAEDPAKLDNK